MSRIASPVVLAALSVVMHDADADDVGLRLQVPARPAEGAPEPEGGPAWPDVEPADLRVWQDDPSGTGVFLDPDEPGTVVCAVGEVRGPAPQSEVSSPASSATSHHSRSMAW